MRGERVAIGLILVAIFAALAFRADQPIVENYVGRQIPTAMVARNLDRGSGFLHPTLDTAPFPNRFLVEPPIYAQMVAWVKAGVGFVWETLGWPPLGFVWERSGRLVSAFMTTLGAWAFHGLVRRREGPAVAVLALGSFGILPVTLRYGRAFQPDATMFGFVLLGMLGWDTYQATGKKRWAWVGGFVLAMGLAVKVMSAWVLIPFFLIMTRLPTLLRALVAALMLVPALVWYLYAWGEVRADAMDDMGTRGSLASVDNAAVWIRTLSPTSWLRFATWEAVGRNMFVRAFTPLGSALTLAGWWFGRSKATDDKLWDGWGIGCGLAIGILGAKWHHGYYWLVVAPLAAVGVARCLVLVAGVGQRGRLGSIGLSSLFLGLSGYQAVSTWRSPPEWITIRAAADRIAAVVPVDGASLLIAPEVVLFYGDRPGLRLELSPEAIERASGEWGDPIALDEATRNPLALVEFYQAQLKVGDPAARFDASPPFRHQGFTPGFVADVGRTSGDDRRTAWRVALRRHPGAQVLIDEPDFILVRLGGTP